MTTAAQNPIMENLPEAEGWKTEHEPELVSWGPGAVLKGILLSVEPIRMADDRPAVEVVIRSTAKGSEGRMFKFFRAANMRHRIEAGRCGEEVRIKCLGDDPEAGTAQNPMRLFDIQFRAPRG